MIKVGLTGGIGSGKTFIAQQFISIGIPVYNSDTQGKYLMANNAPVKNKIIKAFGRKSYTNNELNRPFLAQQVFTSKEKLAVLNSIVHPAVQTDFNNWCKKQTSPYIIKEAAILIESGAYKALDKLIVVTAPKKIRIERVMQRDNMSAEDVEKRINNQIFDNERLSLANYIINNDGTMLVNTQVKNIHNKILQHTKQNQ